MQRKRTKPPKPAGDYAVGYGRPPTHSQFKPGQSGNPKGRPAGTADMTTHIDEALRERVVVTEGGRRHKISKSKAIAKQIVNKAAGGDLPAARLLLQATKATSGNVPLIEPHRAAEAPVVEDPPQHDLSKLTTEQMEKLFEAALILEGKTEERPAPLVPPGEPQESSTEGA